MKPSHKLIFPFLLKNEFQDTIGIEEMTVALHLNFGLIWLILSWLYFCNEEMLSLGKSLLYHLIKGGGEYWVDLTELKFFFNFTIFID